MNMTLALTLLVALYLHTNILTLAMQHQWTVQYAKTNPDGYFRTVIGINDGNKWQFPGPTIRATLGEIINVLVCNGLPSESISIHWHGLHQHGTPWMDGVQQVTQYSIVPGSTFNYTFRADSIGTNIYHSHTGGQYTDGLFGALIVDDPDDPYKNIPDKIIMINEWYHRTVVDTFDIFTQHIPSGPYYHPLVNFVSGLFNGKGRFNCSLLGAFDDTICMLNVSYERIVVNASQTYRFRLISIGSQFSFIFSIDQHNLTIIAIDGIYVKPYTVQRILIGIGQRYDVLVNITNLSGNYWIRAVTERTSDEFKAILQYSTASEIGEPNSIPSSDHNNTLWDEKNLVPTSSNNVSLRPPTFNKQFILNISCNEPVIDKCFVNQIQYRLATTPTLLTMFRKQKAAYNETNILELNYGDTVLLIINNFINGSHPLHLHGHDFYVLGSGSPTELGPSNFGIPNDKDTLNLVNPPIRDTVLLPKYSWLVIEFVADNPGSWFFHCHIQFDGQAGMGIVFNVDDGKIMPPPDDYTLVSNYGALVSPFVNSIAPSNIQVAAQIKYGIVAFSIVLMINKSYFQD